jgi:hypothetical protein
MSNTVTDEITKGDSTPRASFKASFTNFLYAITQAACLKVMVLRMITYISLIIGVILSIVTSAVLGSALVFFEGLIIYILIGVGLFALTEIINRRTSK